MRIFIDSANLDDVRLAFDLGFISGVTTNPILVLREGSKELEACIKSIRGLCDGEILTQVIGSTAGEMLRQAKKIASWDDNISVKFPATREGIKGISMASKEGLRTCATLVFNTTQAIAAALAGATYVAPFVNRSNAIGLDGIALVKTIAEIYRLQKIDTQIIGASIDSPQNFTDMALAGAHVVTGPLHAIEKLVFIGPAESTLVEFLSGWSGDEY